MASYGRPPRTWPTRRAARRGIPAASCAPASCRKVNKLRSLALVCRSRYLADEHSPLSYGGWLSRGLLLAGRPFWFLAEHLLDTLPWTETKQATPRWRPAWLP